MPDTRDNRKHQEAAFTEVSTIDWWFRRHYNLAPTDPRYLGATREQMWVDYWALEFETRWAKATKLHIEVKSMQDLLDVDEKHFPGEPMSDEEFNRRLAQMDTEDEVEQKRIDAGLEPIQIQTDEPPEVLISKKYG